MCATLGDCWYTCASASVGWDGWRGLDGVGTEWVYRIAEDARRGRVPREREAVRMLRVRDIVDAVGFKQAMGGVG